MLLSLVKKQGKPPGQRRASINAPAAAEVVLTLALQASDLSGRRRTERQLLSVAMGQGHLPAWLEAEVALLPAGSNGLIWLELELLESRPTILQSAGPGRC
ncbi:MAG: hypothetical protein FJX32_16215 [Alphaproteobacteria bacterium]|nr:hypothetical protein [Alphaproteobacteria bacterium]